MHDDRGDFVVKLLGRGPETNEFVKELFPKLAKAYENGPPDVVFLQNATPIEKEIVAELKAERWVTEQHGALRLTDLGYKKIRPIVDFWRAVSKPN